MAMKWVAHTPEPPTKPVSASQPARNALVSRRPRWKKVKAEATANRQISAASTTSLRSC
jgi:hypothetical protein